MSSSSLRTTSGQVGADLPRPTKKFAFVSDAAFPFNVGGKETRLYEITTHLARAGHQVDVYTMKWWDNDSRQVSYQGVHFHALMRRRPLYSGERRSIRQALGFGLACLKLGTKSFDGVDVDHMPFFPLFAVRLVCSIRRKRMTATWHEVWGHDYWRSYLGPAGTAAYLVEALAARMPHEILAVSTQTAHRLCSWLKVESAVRTVLPGINFSTIEAAPPAAEKTDVIYAGRLLSNKNIDMLLEALALSSEEIPGISCTIIGEGPERPSLEALSEKLGLADRVRFLDFGSYTELYSRIKSSGVFVLPSSREGFGLTVLEANACGTPVVTVRHPDNAAQDLITEGRNGVVADFSAAAVSGAIIEILRGRLALAPLEHATGLRATFDWQACADAVGNALAPSLTDDGSPAIPPPRAAQNLRYPTMTVDS